MDAKSTIEFILIASKMKYVKEFKFSEKRKYRFDFCIPELKLAIEYNGIFSVKSRHTTVTGYTEDRNKINLAILEGWRVLEYTQLNYKNFSEDLKKITNQ